jgi:hypothetical protein
MNSLGYRCSSLLCVLVGLLGLPLWAQEPAAEIATVTPQEARVRELGNISATGAFSFWTEGVLGDWFLASGPKATLVLTAQGRTLLDVPPRLSVEVTGPEGETRQVGTVAIVSSGFAQYRVELAVRPGVFGLRLRHTNRVVDEKAGLLRHLLVQKVQVEGARRAPYSQVAYALFGDPERETPESVSTGARTAVETASLKAGVDPASGHWRVETADGACRAENLSPVFCLGGLPVDLSQYAVTCEVTQQASEALGDFTGVILRYRKAGEVDLDYTLLFGREREEVVARVDLVNRTGKPLTVYRIAPFVAPSVTLGGRVADWRIIGDAKSNGQAYTSLSGADLTEFNCWWYTAARSAEAGRAVVAGNLTNNKGLGRFLVVPGSDASIRLAAYSDYEGIVLPAEGRIEGEPTLLAFGRRGTDCLERFGDLIARANGIDLRKQHPIDPYVPEYLALFTTWNSWGSSVVKGFPYKFDRDKYDLPLWDPVWRQANQRKVAELGLGKYGYVRPAGLRLKGSRTPLVRRYGAPDSFFPEAQAIAKDHPECFADGRVDFSNPATQALERQRAEPAFADPKSIVQYSWDFTDQWRKLPNQYDPSMTSADTYRIGTGIWRDLVRKHPGGGYAFIWMNVVGINYDRVDVIHIGADSDQGYYGGSCTFTQGLPRQISGRYFYNGRVWWNSPDSYHVYVGGLYSYNQAKVHASFCSIAGNLVHLAEPLTDEEIPQDRLDMIRRVSPTTADTATAVDVFEHCPARLWNLRVQRPFGAWNVVGLFNVDMDRSGTPVTQEVKFADLGLEPDREYLVYEFWSQRFLGAVKGGFARTLQAPDCEVYSIVPREDRPVLVSTSRHLRQMAYDILDLRWDPAAQTLSGTSKVVEGDPYQLRVYLPPAYRLAGAQIGGLNTKIATQGELLTVEVVPQADGDLHWTLQFARD